MSDTFELHTVNKFLTTEADLTIPLHFRVGPRHPAVRPAAGLDHFRWILTKTSLSGQPPFTHARRVHRFNAPHSHTEAGMRLPSFAIIDRSRPADTTGVLMIVDSREDADDIAFELHRRGLDIEVREIPTPSPGELT